MRIVGSRKQTVNVIEPIDPIRFFDGPYVGSRYGTVTSYDTSNRTIGLLAQHDGGVVNHQAVARKHVSLDSHFLLGLQKRFINSTAFEPGREAMLFCHRFSTDPNEVYLTTINGDSMRPYCDVEDNGLIVQVWRDGELHQQHIALDSDALVRFNYVDTDRSTALQEGAWVHVEMARPMRVLTGRWDRPVTPDTSAPPSIVGITAQALDAATIQVTWTSAFGIGMPTVAYAVYRDGELAGTTVHAEWTDSGLAEETTHRYTVRPLNRWGVEGEDSAPVSASTGLDRVAPQVVYASADSELNTLTFVFDKPMDQRSATNLANYSIQPSTSIQSVSSADDGRRVTVQADDLIEGAGYTATLSDIVDASRSANAIAGEGVFVLPGLACTDGQ